MSDTSCWHPSTKAPLLAIGIGKDYLIIARVHSSRPDGILEKEYLYGINETERREIADALLSLYTTDSGKTLSSDEADVDWMSENMGAEPLPCMRILGRTYLIAKHKDGIPEMIEDTQAVIEALNFIVVHYPSTVISEQSQSHSLN